MAGGVVTYNAKPTYRPRWYKDVLGERPDALAIQYTSESEEAALKWAQETIAKFPKLLRNRYKAVFSAAKFGEWIVYEGNHRNFSLLTDYDFCLLWKPAIMCGYPN